MLLQTTVVYMMSLMVMGGLRVRGGKTQRYRDLRYHTQITSTPHELRWDFTDK